MMIVIMMKVSKSTSRSDQEATTQSRLEVQQRQTEVITGKLWRARRQLARVENDSDVEGTEGRDAMDVM